MSHEEAFQALKDGDLRMAIPLLEHAVRETSYSSDVLNQAYTQALYRAGENTRLANAAFEIGDSLVETDPALAMDYFQRAFLGGLDASCVRHVGEIFEQWAAPKPRRKKSARKRVAKVAHVVGSLASEHAPARHVSMLVKSLSQQGVESRVFTTEWSSSWFFNTPGLPSSQPSGLVPDAVIASVHGNFNERAERIASAVREYGAQAAFFHGDLSEQITARVASHRPASIQVSVAHAAEMEPNLFDGYIHFTTHSLAATRHPGIPAVCISPASDIAERMKGLPSNMRTLMGLDAAGTVSATLGDMRNATDSRFLEVLSGILNALPGHYHLFAGTGDVKEIRAHFHAEGVLPRVRFMGSMADAPSVLAIADIYLAPFLDSNDGALLEAMGAGRPCVVLDTPGNSAVERLGVRELLTRSVSAYTQTAERLLRDVGERNRCAERVQSRFRSEFHPDLLGQRYLDFLRQL